MRRDTRARCGECIVVWHPVRDPDKLTGFVAPHQWRLQSNMSNGNAE